MKRSITALLLFIAAALVGLAGVVSMIDARAQALPESKVVKLNSRVYVLLGPIQHANPENQGYMVNSTVLVGDEGIVLVESGGTDEVGRHIRQAVQAISPKPITHVVNTHHHGDHYLGNTAFDGATFISSEKCRDMVVQTGDEWVAQMEAFVGRKLPDTRPIPASLTYAEGTKSEVVLNGIRMVFWVPKGSHTVGDLMVYLPDDQVLIAGDVLVNRVVPTMQDGVVRNWLETLAEIGQAEVTTYVPGHGPLMTREQVEALHAAIERFYGGVKQAYLDGVDMQDVRKTLDLSEWEKLERAYVIGRNIDRAYLEIEQEHF